MAIDLVSSVAGGIVPRLMKTARTCWLVTEGHAGMEAQCRGLADALGVSATVKRIRARAPWSWLPAGLWFFPLAAPGREGDSLRPPWPDLVISCGSRGAVLAAAIRATSGGRTRAVHIQHPKMNLKRFDAVVAPRHDDLAGENVIVTKAAVHPVTPAKLAEGAERWAPVFADLPRPLIAVLVGGSNGRHRLTPEISRNLAADLARMAESTGGSLAVTPSRRTGEENEQAFREGLRDTRAYIWDKEGDNPYFGLLALADVIVVTEDSVSMTSEAIATGKPVYVAPLTGESRRIRRFHQDLIDDGITRRFDGTFATWRYDPPDDTARAAAIIRQRLSWGEAPHGA